MVESLNISEKTLQMTGETKYNLGFGNGFNDGFNQGLEAAGSLAFLLLISLIIQVFARNIMRHDGRFVIEIFGSEVFSVDVGYQRLFSVLEASGFAIQILGVALIFVVVVLGVPVVDMEVSLRP